MDLNLENNKYGTRLYKESEKTPRDQRTEKN